MTTNENYYKIKEALRFLEKAREIVDQVEEEQGTCVIGDALTEIIEGLEFDMMQE